MYPELHAKPGGQASLSTSLSPQPPLCQRPRWTRLQKREGGGSARPCRASPPHPTCHFKTKRQGQEARDFPGGPVAKNLPSNGEDVGLISDQGTKIPRATREVSVPQLEKVTGRPSTAKNK